MGQLEELIELFSIAGRVVVNLVDDHIRHHRRGGWAFDLRIQRQGSRGIFSRRGPVAGQPRRGRNAQALQRSATPIDRLGSFRPRNPVIEFHTIGNSIDRVQQQNLIAIIVEAPLKISQQVSLPQVETGSEKIPVTADKDIARRRQHQAGGKFKRDTAIELPAIEGDSRAAGIEQLDKLEIPSIGSRWVVMNLIDNNRAIARRMACKR